ncbi:MAG: hypothetical protein ACI4VL_02230 [Bacilli bacterium]
MYKIDYLLRYVSNETYKKILNNKSSYILKLVQDNYVDTDLNIKYLIKYGVTNIDTVVFDRLEELTVNHNDFIKKIKNYEKNLTKEEIIMLFENV